MNPNDPNVVLVELVANHLGEDFRRELVFVGGAVAGLLITDPAFPAIRATQDVDLIVHVATLSDYHATERALRARGFVQDMASRSSDLPLAHRFSNR
jgi:predicted nucleotidyltransferase